MKEVQQQMKLLSQAFFRPEPTTSRLMLLSPDQLQYYSSNPTIAAAPAISAMPTLEPNVKPEGRARPGKKRKPSAKRSKSAKAPKIAKVVKAEPASEQK